MKMLKILLRAMEKQACAHGMCWHGFSDAHSSLPTSWSFTLHHRRSSGTLSFCPFLAWHGFIKPTRTARKFRLRRGSRLAVTSAMTSPDFPQVLRAPSPLSETGRRGISVRPGYSCWHLAPTLALRLGAPRRGSVLLSTVWMCLCVRRGRRKKKKREWQSLGEWSRQELLLYRCASQSRLKLPPPPTPGERRTPPLAFSPSHDFGFCV